MLGVKKMSLEDKLSKLEMSEFLGLTVKFVLLQDKYLRQFSWPKKKKVTFTYIADFYCEDLEENSFVRYKELHLKAYDEAVK